MENNDRPAFAQSAQNSMAQQSALLQNVKTELEQIKDLFGLDVASEICPLPSKGKFYPAGHPWHNKEQVYIKAMTASEEDILMNQAYAKNGETIVRLINACLVGQDRLPLSGDLGMPSILIGDQLALMFFIRIHGFGPDYTTEVKCPSCGKQSKHTFDLTERGLIEGYHNSISDGVNLFEFTLPTCKKKVHFKLPTIADEKEAEELQKVAKSNLAKLGKSAQVGGIITNSLLLQIQAIEDANGTMIRDKANLMKFIKYIPARDSSALRKHIKECEPGIDQSVAFECPHCNHSEDVGLPMSKEFFWPDFG
jgi:hypothetical protein